jgi:hypothetical protein
MRLTIARYYTPTGRFIQKPYDDLKSYKNDISQRFLNGELMHQDSVKLPDSLKFKTLVKGREVYSGGGIMPDYFVAIDTSDISSYYKKVNRGGHLNGFALKYANSNRAQIKQAYPEFIDYKKNFIIDKEIMDDFVDYVSNEDSSIVLDKTEFETSKKLIELRLKANIALNIWEYAQFYEVFNRRNEELQKAIELLNSGKDLFKN